MDISKFLAKVIGIYLVIVTLAMLINMQQFDAVVSSLINNTALMFVTGFVTLILGILLIVSHNIWQWHWRVIITIFAWCIFLKGASIVLHPQFIDELTVYFLKSPNVGHIAAGIDGALGLLLCYLGFKR